eukprot:TRINITY_DN16025_c0_g2_i5.p1 TRINITY_DN16025_c0_g2~~TRINITY_DN16025_c0_g2_i5.p1  ORF type:complete len:226 (+),score=9.88 TRINITY_DN16025_c0_g2_i5:201-878(+)
MIKAGVLVIKRGFTEQTRIMGKTWRANLAFLVLLLLRISQSSEGVKVHSTQLAALIAVKESMMPASAFSSWVNTNECAKWEGITCDSAGLVTSLNFSGVLESGTIPEEISQLTHLTSLILSRNGLTGAIPSSIGNLTNLITLDLNTNSYAGSNYVSSGGLYGPIPSGIVNLINLVILDLQENYLSGFIPFNIGDLRRLVYLSLRRNDLLGPVPSSIGNLSNLTFL